MPGENSALIKGVIDVGVIVPCCFENPLKEESISFIERALAQGRGAALPVTAVMGAYHIVTRYLRVPRVAAKKVLAGIVESGSGALYPHIAPEDAADALDYASAYGIEAWDGYLVAVARRLGAPTIYTLDAGLSKVREVAVVVPFSREAVDEYHAFIKGRVR
jgi:predicted nucleic acid-binding protein